MTEPDLVEVQLLQVPVPLWSRAEQQTSDLLREFALASAHPDEDDHPLPARLSALIDTLSKDFSGTSDEPTEQLFAAAAQGVDVIDRLLYLTPAAAAPASRALGDMLDEADAYCLEGRHLLTLAADAQVVSFRRWYLTEFIRQVAGEQPLPWPAYDGWWPSPDT